MSLASAPTRLPSASVSSIGGHARFKKLQKIGEGSFGDVFKGLDTETNEVVAVKVINLEEAEEEIEAIREEVTMLSECHSQYVTRYITSYTNGSDLCIVMEFLGGGSVHDLLDEGPLDENYVAIITRELLKACDYLHTNGKIHRGQITHSHAME
jgi:serine/threonine-protein kinase 24/25/MST4